MRRASDPRAPGEASPGTGGGAPYSTGGGGGPQRGPPGAATSSESGQPVPPSASPGAIRHDRWAHRRRTNTAPHPRRNVPPFRSLPPRKVRRRLGHRLSRRVRNLPRSQDRPICRSHPHHPNPLGPNPTHRRIARQELHLLHRGPHRRRPRPNGRRSFRLPSRQASPGSLDQRENRGRAHRVAHHRRVPRPKRHLVRVPKGRAT